MERDQWKTIIITLKNDIPTEKQRKKLWSAAPGLYDLRNTRFFLRNSLFERMCKWVESVFPVFFLRRLSIKSCSLKTWCGDKNLSKKGHFYKVSFSFGFKIYSKEREKWYMFFTVTSLHYSVVKYRRKETSDQIEPACICD